MLAMSLSGQFYALWNIIIIIRKYRHDRTFIFINEPRVAGNASFKDVFKTPQAGKDHWPSLIGW